MRKINENQMFVFDYPINCTWKYYVKRLLSPILGLIYKQILRIKCHKPVSKRYVVSICAIFKDEAHNLKEWIEYHRIVGVEHFYLYNNFSSDDFLYVLEPYIKDNLVTLTDWPILQGQMKAYEDCFNKYRKESQWISFLDIDEFFVPHYDLSVVDWISQFSKYPCVIVYWKMFGTSGRLEHNPKQLITEQYIISWSKLDSIGKVFWNTAYDIENYSSMHIFRASIRLFGCNIAIPPINQFGKFVLWDIHRFESCFKQARTVVQINHYWSKSYEDMVVKKFKRGDAFFGELAPTRNLRTFLLHEHHNKSTDYKIYRFLIELKIAMGMTDHLTNSNGSE